MPQHEPANSATVKVDRRARLGPAAQAMFAVLGPHDDCNSLLQPLWATRGVLFPYTPDITFGGAANYSSWHFTHSNYQQFQYQNSMPSEIQVTATFTAQTNAEARYMLAVLTFLRASTMLAFGNAAVGNNTAGTPPPVLRFNYLGDHMFNNVPVVLQNYSYLLEREVDYVEIVMPGVDSNQRNNPTGGEGLSGALAAARDFLGSAYPSRAGSSTYMPTQIVITMLLGIQQNPRNVRENFDLDKFKTGDLITKGFM